MFRHTIDFSPLIRNVILLALLGCLFTSNPLLTALAVLFVPIAAKLLWRKNEPPIIFFAFIMQWIQVTIKIFQADFLAVDIKEVYSYPDEIVPAFLLSITGLISLSLGINICLKNLAPTKRQVVKYELRYYNTKRLTIVYLAAIILVTVLARYSFYFTGMQQFIIKLMDFKWSIFFIFYLVVFSKRTNQTAFFLILTFEVILGFTGFFSNFKEFFLIGIICFLFLTEKINTKEYLAIAGVFLVVANLMIVWQYVKLDYRRYLSGGERSQNVTVSSGEALDKLTDIVSEVEIENYNDGMTQFLDRVSYIDFFSAAKSYTPKSTPHENGALWANAVKNIFMPRFFFPDKAYIDDSEKTKKYTGLNFAGADQGTSISLGYMAETYVDFGQYVMFIPLFMFGYVIGWIYKFVIKNSFNTLWGYAMIIPIFFQINAFEIALDKIVGGLIAYFIVYLIVRKSFIKTLHVYLFDLNKVDSPS